MRNKFLCNLKHVKNSRHSARGTVVIRSNYFAGGCDKYSEEEGAVAVKIIHGLGSGSIVEKVRSWAKEQEGRFKAVIPGENYNAFNKDAVDMRSELSNKQDRDFNNRNSGVTIFWL